MDIAAPHTLLGELSPTQFMRRHWQRKPLLVRQAVPGMRAPLSRQQLLALAAREDVQSRLVRRDTTGRWSLRHGPFAARTVPAARRPDWTLLVQGADLHDGAAHALLQRFAFIPHARLDDLMISLAGPGGGVGPHYDSYDVFLLQASGRRRWRIGRQKDLTLQPGLALKILADFKPEAEWVLEPGDMLYLPPGYAHEGVAVGEAECQTCSIGFRAPTRGELACELLQRLADEANEAEDDGDGHGDQRSNGDVDINATTNMGRYTDAGAPAAVSSGAIPEALQKHAHAAVAAALRRPQAIERALGEHLSEPKSNVWFEPAAPPRTLRHGVTLDRRTRMLHDARHIYVNGESWRAAGADARLMRRLADQRRLEGAELAAASPAAMELLRNWCAAGWLHAVGAQVAAKSGTPA